MPKQQLIDLHGNLIVLGKELGKGGEGIVYHIQNNLNIVAKIYLKQPDKQKADKILNMVKSTNESLLSLTAWPLKSIHNRSGDLVGFTMQKLQGYSPLFELYSPKIRLQKFPQADWRFLIHTATNIARAFSIIHESGHIIGDVNHGNIFVKNDATIKFIDSDSFQISINNSNWLCEVGVATHQPPEMQGQKTYRGIIRTRSHDNFGLAVLIFQLLCLARHPFSGRFLGNGDMPIEKAIVECRFAYSRNNMFTKMLPPPASLEMTSLTTTILSLFERAFSKERIKDGLRPTSTEWVRALTNLAISLKQCQINHGHYHLNTLSSCPWCDIEVKSNTILFPIKFTHTNQSFEILWQQVLALTSIKRSSLYQDPLLTSVCASEEIKKMAEKYKKNQKKCIRFSLILGSISLLIGPLFGQGLLSLMLIGIAVTPFICYQIKKGNFIHELKKDYIEARSEWNQLHLSLTKLEGNGDIKNVMKDLSLLKQKNDALAQERQEKIIELRVNKKQQKLIAHLHNYRITTANIDGIGYSRIPILQSYGVETAADISKQKLDSIRGFGPKLTQKLLNWRNKCELSFIFNASKDISAIELQTIDQNIMIKSRKLEQKLIIGLAQLKKIHTQIKNQQEQLLSKASILFDTYIKAIANARELGIKL